MPKAWGGCFLVTAKYERLYYEEQLLQNIAAIKKVDVL
jgi:hypothetical protein